MENSTVCHEYWSENETNRGLLRHLTIVWNAWALFLRIVLAEWIPKRKRNNEEKKSAIACAKKVRKEIPDSNK